MRRFSSAAAIAAFLLPAMLPLLARGQVAEFQKEILAGATENTVDIALKIAGTVANPLATYVSVLPLQNAPPLPVPAASFEISLNGSAFVVPTAAFLPLGAGPTGGQVRIDPANPASGGRVTFHVTHNAAITTVASQTLTVKVKIPLAVLTTTCFYGVANHASGAGTLLPKFSLRTPAGFFSDNYCNSVTGNPALSTASMAFTNGTVNSDFPLKFTVINTGTGNLDVGTPTSAAPFVPTLLAGATLLPNGSREIQVVYHPTVATPPTQTGTVTVPSVAGPPSCSVALTGEAVFRELVLCIDCSNSMNWDINGTPLSSCPVSSTTALNYATDARIRLVQAALGNLNSRMEFYGDKVVHWSIVQFPGSDLTLCPASNADAAASASSTWSNVYRSLGLYDSTASPSPLTQINGATTFAYYHGTPMKQGLSTSLAQFSASTGPKRAILLLSDGAHNVPPAESPLDVTSTIPLAGPRIFAVGFGLTGDVNMTMLQDIVADAPGLFYNATTDTGDASDLTTFFNKIFTNFMQLQANVDPRAQVAPGAKNIHKALVTEYDKKIAFTANWKTPGLGRLSLELVSPGGERITPKTPWVKFYEGPTHQMYGIEVSNRIPERSRLLVGEWTLEVSYPAPAGAPAPAPESYAYDGVMSSGLEMKVDFNRVKYQTGDRVVVTARLSELGVPMLEKAVRLHLHRPDEGLGKWFAANAATLQQIEQGIAPVFGSGKSALVEALPNVFKKQYFMTQIQKVALPPMKGITPPTGIVLHDDGQHGDLRANDGIYSVVLDNMLEKTGTYRFQLEATGETSHQNKFRRESETQFFVSPRIEIDPKFTRMVLQRVEGGENRSFRRFRATVTPQDRFGNLMGPGFERAIRIESSNARALTKDVEDDLKGNYFRIFEYDVRGSAPIVRGSVNGQPLEEDQFREGDGGTTEDACAPCRWLYIVLVLLAIAVVLAILKLKKP